LAAQCCVHLNSVVHTTTAHMAVLPETIHVLLVDDEQLSRFVVGNLLRKCNYAGGWERPHTCDSSSCGVCTTRAPISHQRSLQAGQRHTLCCMSASSNPSLRHSSGTAQIHCSAHHHHHHTLRGPVSSCVAHSQLPLWGNTKPKQPYSLLFRVLLLLLLLQSLLWTVAPRHWSCSVAPRLGPSSSSSR
jgi:hypothetical protein